MAVEITRSDRSADGKGAIDSVLCLPRDAPVGSRHGE